METLTIYLIDRMCKKNPKTITRVKYRITHDLKMAPTHPTALFYITPIKDGVFLPQYVNLYLIYNQKRKSLGLPPPKNLQDSCQETTRLLESNLS